MLAGLRAIEKEKKIKNKSQIGTNIFNRTVRFEIGMVFCWQIVIGFKTKQVRHNTYKECSTKLTCFLLVFTRKRKKRENYESFVPINRNSSCNKTLKQQQLIDNCKLLCLPTGFNQKAIAPSLEYKLLPTYSYFWIFSSDFVFLKNNTVSSYVQES